VKHRKQSSSAKPPDPGASVLVQARISQAAHKLLVERAEKDTRSIAN
jgi:hypothetical protein